MERYPGYEEDWFEHNGVTYGTLNLIKKLRATAHQRGFFIGFATGQLLVLVVMLIFGT